MPLAPWNDLSSRKLANLVKKLEGDADHDSVKAQFDKRKVWYDHANELAHHLVGVGALTPWTTPGLWSFLMRGFPEHPRVIYPEASVLRVLDTVPDDAEPLAVVGLWPLVLANADAVLARESELVEAHPNLAGLMRFVRRVGGEEVTLTDADVREVVRGVARGSGELYVDVLEEGRPNFEPAFPPLDLGRLDALLGVDRDVWGALLADEVQALPEERALKLRHVSPHLDAFSLAQQVSLATRICTSKVSGLIEAVGQLTLPGDEYLDAAKATEEDYRLTTFGRHLVRFAGLAYARQGEVPARWDEMVLEHRPDPDGLEALVPLLDEARRAGLSRRSVAWEQFFAVNTSSDPGHDAMEAANVEQIRVHFADPASAIAARLDAGPHPFSPRLHRALLDILAEQDVIEPAYYRWLTFDGRGVGESFEKGPVWGGLLERPFRKVAAEDRGALLLAQWRRTRAPGVLRLSAHFTPNELLEVVAELAHHTVVPGQELESLLRALARAFPEGASEPLHATLTELIRAGAPGGFAAQTRERLPWIPDHVLPDQTMVDAVREAAARVQGEARRLVMVGVGREAEGKGFRTSWRSRVGGQPHGDVADQIPEGKRLRFVLSAEDVPLLTTWHPGAKGVAVVSAGAPDTAEEVALSCLERPRKKRGQKWLWGAPLAFAEVDVPDEAFTTSTPEAKAFRDLLHRTASGWFGGQPCMIHDEVTGPVRGFHWQLNEGLGGLFGYPGAAYMLDSGLVTEVE